MSENKGAGSASHGQCLGGLPGSISTSTGRVKKVSPFCSTCFEFDCTAEYTPSDRAKMFKDRRGLQWECLLGGECPHAIVAGGRLYSCRMRTQQIRDESRGRS